MDLFKPTLKKAFRELEKTLVKNIAHDLYDITFHENATDEELMLFYGGSVSREAMLTDTRRKLDGDQRLLRFYQNNRNIINEYGTKDATADFNRNQGSDTVEVPGSASDVPGTGENSGAGPNEGSEGDHGSEDHADEGNHDTGDVSKERGGSGESEEHAGGSGPDDQRGEEVAGGTGGESENGSREVRLPLPIESEARRLELIRIEDNVGVIMKLDGDEAVVLPYTK